MAVTSNERYNTHLPKLVKKGKLLKDKEKMLTCKKVTWIDPGNSRCEKRKRATCSDLYNNEEVNSAVMVMERAMVVKANLAAEFPSLMKCMLPSHVSGGFWLGLPKSFCSNHLPKQDTIIVLEDESGKEYETKYLAEKIGLSAGWRGFSMAHKLVRGDILIFHLVEPSKFKVYIVRSSGSDEMNGAVGLPKLDTCYRQKDSVTFHKEYHAEKDISVCEEKEDKYWEALPLAQEIPQVNFKKHKQMTASIKLEPMSDQSENDSRDLGSEVVGGIRFSESTLDFKEVKSIEDFSIVVDGLIINSALSKHLRTKYYELCRSQNAFLHECLLDGLNCRLTAGMIAETINIADAIRASKITNSEGNFVIWDQTLKAFKMMGMNVSFLQARLDQLMTLASKSKRSKQARLERAHAEEEKRTLEMKILEVRETINKLDSDIQTLEIDTDRLEAMFQEVAMAPW